MSGATGPAQQPYSIIAPTSPFVDIRTGRITREWYRFLLSLFVSGGSGQPVPSVVVIDALVNQLQTLLAASLPPQGPDFQRQIEDLNILVATVAGRSAGNSGATPFTGKPFSYTLAWGGGAIAMNGTIDIEGDAQNAAHILGVKHDNGVGGGSITGAFQINGTPITGLGAVVNNGAGTSTATAANALVPGAVLRVVLSGVTGSVADGGYFTPFGTYD